MPIPRRSAPYAAANKAANRVLKRIEELEPKIKTLDDQLTGITSRVNQISKQLSEIEISVKSKREGVKNETSRATGQG